MGTDRDQKLYESLSPTERRGIDETLWSYPAATLSEAIRDHWWASASMTTIANIIDAEDDPRIKDLAILLCAEACASRCGDSRVEQCRRIRLAWVREETTEGTKGASMYLALEAARETAGEASWSARATSVGSVLEAACCASHAVSDRDDADESDRSFDAAHSAIASPIRTLYPDPLRLDWKDALTRWEAAVAEARGLLEFKIQQE